MFDPEVSVRNPRKFNAMPIYEGLASYTYTCLIPGKYDAVTMTGDEIDDLQDVTVIVTEFNSHAERTPAFFMAVHLASTSTGCGMSAYAKFYDECTEVTREVTAFIENAISDDDGGGAYIQLDPESGNAAYIAHPGETASCFPDQMGHWMFMGGDEIEVSPLTIDSPPADVAAWIKKMHDKYPFNKI